jgi:hypothetical protein
VTLAQPDDQGELTGVETKELGWTVASMKNDWNTVF